MPLMSVLYVNFRPQRSVLTLHTLNARFLLFFVPSQSTFGIRPADAYTATDAQCFGVHAAGPRPPHHHQVAPPTCSATSYSVFAAGRFVNYRQQGTSKRHKVFFSVQVNSYLN